MKYTFGSNSSSRCSSYFASFFFKIYVAGFETTSSTLSYCLYELARHPEIQQQIQEEIETVLDQNGGTFTYDSLIELKYLESVIDGM